MSALFSFEDVTVTPDDATGPGRHAGRTRRPAGAGRWRSARRGDGTPVDAPTRHALRGCTVEIPDGVVTVVLGPSGAGKSTLLRLCNRLEVPSSGTVRFRGDDVGGLDPLALRRRVGMVFQRPTLFAGTVRDNLLVAAPDAGAEDLVVHLGRCGLGPEFLDRSTDGLSGGEAQRVCLARTLAAGPEVLLMDEPTGALDPEHRLVIEDLALGLVAGGLPVVWVTHDLDQASRLGGFQVVLVEGRAATADEAEAFRGSMRRRPPAGPDGPGAPDGQVPP